MVDVGEDGRERKSLAFGVALSQGAMGGIVHHEKGEAILDSKVQDADDMGMH